MRLTFVTPTYNQAEYLAECIDSVLPQIVNGYEYIVVNDGSTDGTFEILEKYKNEDRVQISTQKNQGQVKTLNHFWKKSSSEYLGYLSSDDVLVPNALNQLINFMDEHPDVVAVYPDFYLINDHGVIINSVSNGDFDRQLIFEKLICQPGPCTIFRRSAFQASGEWRSDLRITPDLEFWSRVSILGQIARYPHKLAKYRVHDTSQSTGIMPYSRANEILSMPRIFASTLSKSNFKYSHVEAVGSSYILAGYNHYRSKRIFLATIFLSVGYFIRIFLNIKNGARNLFKWKTNDKF